MTTEQVRELIQVLKDLKEQIAVIRDVTERTANLTPEQRLEIENNSRVRRGMQPKEA